MYHSSPILILPFFAVKHPLLFYLQPPVGCGGRWLCVREPPSPGVLGHQGLVGKRGKRQEEITNLPNVRAREKLRVQ